MICVVTYDNYDRNVVEYETLSDFPNEGNTLHKHRWSLMEHLQVATFQNSSGKFGFPPFGNSGNEL